MEPTATNHWTVSTESERGYYGEYSSREEAIEWGIAEFNGAPFWIGEARPPAPLSEGVDAEGIINSIIEFPLEEDWNNDFSEGWIPTQEQFRNLSKRIGAVIDQWVKDHKLEPKWFLVDNPEFIDPDELPGQGQ